MERNEGKMRLRLRHGPDYHHSRTHTDTNTIGRYQNWIQSYERNERNISIELVLVITFELWNIYKNADWPNCPHTFSCPPGGILGWFRPMELHDISFLYHTAKLGFLVVKIIWTWLREMNENCSEKWKMPFYRLIHYIDCKVNITLHYITLQFASKAAQVHHKEKIFLLPNFRINLVNR